jgi:predicted lipoprotein with Yx(FWY)xxD motif
MKCRYLLALAGACLIPGAASGQPVDLPILPATTTHYPPGVSVRNTAAGPVYVDSRGRTLYGMDMRTLLRWGPDPSKHCQGACAETWEPLLAPAGSTPNIAYPLGFGERLRREAAGEKPAAGNEDGDDKPSGEEFYDKPQKAPDWTIIAGPQGPQWVYKGWHMVFTRKGDQPGSTAYDGAENLTWNTLKFVPPVPEITAPADVTTVFVDGKYALADKEGRVLFTGKCAKGCAWRPLPGAMASRGLGQWKVSEAGDHPQWTYRGRPVFVSQRDDPTQVPEDGVILRP